MANGQEDLDKEGCEYGRRIADRMERVENNVEGIQVDIKDIAKDLRGRPSWAVSVIITILSSSVVGLLVAMSQMWGS